MSRMLYGTVKLRGASKYYARKKQPYMEPSLLNSEVVNVNKTTNLTNNRTHVAEEDLKLLYVLMQPTRQKIIKLLKNSKEPLYIKEIAKRVAEEPRNVSFHLATLAECGLVDGEYREIESPTHHSAVTGRAGKFYKLTPKVEEVIKRLATEMW